MLAEMMIFPQGAAQDAPHISRSIPYSMVIFPAAFMFHASHAHVV